MQYSTVTYQTVFNNSDFRYEAEFFLPKYIIQEKKLLAIKSLPLSDCSSFVNGRAYDSSEFSFTGDVFISKIGDVTQKRDFSLWEKVTKKHFEEINGRYLKHNDILMTLTGDPPDVGKVQLIHNPPKNQLSWNQRVALLRLKKQEIILSPECFFAILSSKYCREHIERWAKGIRQRNVGNPAALKMLIPVLNDDLQNAIKNTIISSFATLEQSTILFQQANYLLLSELGLTDWQPKHCLSCVKNYSETEKAERIDAEYFQPKYEEIIKAIKKYKGGWDTLGNLVTVKKCVEVGSEEYLDDGVPFVRVSNLSPFEITEEKYISEKLYSELMQYQPKQGEILFSKDGSPGTAYYLYEQPPKMIPSGGILRLKRKTDKVSNEFLTMALNSILTKEQVNRDVGGSIILHWRPDQVKETVIPLLSKDKQAKIQQKIAESFALRKQSKHLLECAKKTVEMAIEQNEKTALQWLEKQVRRI